MALAALDPWTVNFMDRDGNDDLRIEALELFAERIEDHRDLEPMRFIDGNFWVAYYEVASRLADDDTAAAFGFPQAQDLQRLFALLQADHELQVEPPDVTIRWLHEVCAVVRPDDHPDWRDPIVFVPEYREGYWPRGEYSISGRQRLVVVLQRPDDNPFFARDFDPWRCERARQVDEDQADRDLPRPQLLDRRPMREWAALLATVDDLVGAETQAIDFVPDAGWNPLTVDKKQWRDCPFGAHGEKLVRKWRKKGPRDRRGRIWAWDDATHRNHWDVQHENSRDDRYMNVSPDGQIATRYDD